MEQCNQPQLDGNKLRRQVEATPEILRVWDKKGNNALHLLCLNPALTEEVLLDFMATEEVRSYLRKLCQQAQNGCPQITAAGLVQWCL